MPIILSMGKVKQTTTATVGDDAAAAEPSPVLTDATNVPVVTSAVPPKPVRGRKAKQYTALEARIRAECQATFEAALARERADAAERLAEKEHQMATMRRIAAEADEETKNLNTIEKPHGSAGREYCLIDEMGLSDNKGTYNNIIDLVHESCIKHKLDRNITFRAQPASKLLKVCQDLRDQEPFMKRFVNDWPTHELTKQYLKHNRQYKKKKAAALAAQQRAHPLPAPRPAGPGSAANDGNE